MKTSVRHLALTAALLGAAALAPLPSLAAGHGGFGGGHGFSGGHAGGGWQGRGGNSFHGGGAYHGGGYYRGGGYRGGWGHGGWGHDGWRHSGWRHGGWGPGYFWGGLGLGLGVAAIGYYGGYYGGYGGDYYAPYPAYGGYVVDSPEVIVGPTYSTGQPVPQAARAPDPIFYPRNGQSAAATESDRRDCNRWATSQPGAMGDASIFQRATLACMEGRGYTAR
ncbi:MAG: hypothetical protein ABI364_01280 [Caldimonas sp.]